VNPVVRHLHLHVAAHLVLLGVLHDVLDHGMLHC
jgi:hypothetical protein